MSEHLDHEQLERATGRTPLNRETDATAASLQDGFLALGRAVDDAQCDWSEEQLLARLQGAAASVQPDRADSRWTVMQWLAAGVLAASALFATARVLLTAPGNSPAIVSTSPSENPLPESVAAPQLAEVTDRSWADPLDEELSTAATALESYSGFGADVDRSLTNFSQQIQSLSADLEAGSL